jgi:D-alanyl-D-alanine dipeptidase
METPPQLARILATSSNTAPEENGNSQVVSRSGISPDDDSKPVHYIDANGNILVDIRDADPRGVLSSSNLNPKVKAMIVEVVYKLQAEGYRPYIVESFRTLERQNQIPRENTQAKAGRSWHNYGLAVDIAFWNANHTGPTWDDPQSPWDRLGALGKEAGFTQWGGDWKELDDRSHLEYHPQNPRPSLAPENWINLYLKDPDHPNLVSAWASVGIPTTHGEVWLAVSMRQEITENSSERQDFEEGLAQSRLKALEDHNPDGLPPPPPPGAATLPRNISEAIAKGEIEVEAEGTGNPSSLRLRINNKNPDQWMQIGIPPGTTFNPGTLNTQNMMIR